jgi:rod shape determining protein RodA
MRWNEIAKANALFLICIGGLIAASLITLWGIPAPRVKEGQPPAPEHYFFFKQLVWLGASLGCLAILLIPQYLRYRTHAYWLFAVSLVAVASLRLCPATIAPIINGARRWFSVAGITVQPSEFAKIASVLALSRYMMYQDNIKTWTGLIGPFLITSCPLLLVLLQPDLGTAMLFFPALVAMVFAAGAKRSHLVLVLVATLAFLPVAYYAVLHDYQRKRLTSFLWPSDSPQGDSYQQLRAIASVASGGWMGADWAEGQSNYAFTVPENHTDFVFSTFAENSGLFGTTLLCLLFLGYMLGGLTLAFRTREPFGRLVVVGLITMQTVQAAINIGMNIGIAPITGITLPFVSYGGSSLVASFLALALILNVNVRWVPSFGTREFEGESGAIRQAGLDPWKRDPN